MEKNVSSGSQTFRQREQQGFWILPLHSVNATDDNLLVDFKVASAEYDNDTAASINSISS